MDNNSIFGVAFTGTQRGMTDDQKLELRRLLVKWKPAYLVHGGCIGADDEADEIANDLKIDRIVRPQNNVPDKSVPTEVFKQRLKSRVTILPAAPAPGRNIDIIRTGRKLIACPRLRKEELRSGTWMTIRNGRRILGKYNVEIIWP